MLSLFTFSKWTYIILTLRRSFVSDEWSLEQQLVKLQLLTESMSGEEIARELVSVFKQIVSLHA